MSSASPFVVIVARDRWIRGKDAWRVTAEPASVEPRVNDSFLCRARDGKSCCLGFAASQLSGWKRSDFLGIQEPDEIESTLARRIPNDAVLDSLLARLEPITVYMTDAEEREIGVTAALDHNDRLTPLAGDTAMSDGYRERLLAEDFEVMGLEVRFVDTMLPEHYALLAAQRLARAHRKHLDETATDEDRAFPSFADPVTVAQAAAVLAGYDEEALLDALALDTDHKHMIPAIRMHLRWLTGENGLRPD